MSALVRPIPPLYTVYVLRSTVRPASLYIGSTPNPPRRLRQHNGLVKGGAARTSRYSARPWEMVSLVSGFPGSLAALKFEWALNNPHVSLHIPKDSRISISKRRKRSGHLARPRPTIQSIVSNVHLLLRVPSFARWPLQVHFFAQEIHKAWTTCCKTATEPLRASIPVHTDFDPAKKTARARKASPPPADSGIHALPRDYKPMKSYVEKTKLLYSARIKGGCVICRKSMFKGKGIYVTCSNTGCDASGHIACWSRHLLGSNADGDVLPISGHCPKCSGEVKWGEMMTETTLRLRGEKEIEQLMKEPRRRKAAAADSESDDDDDDSESTS